MEQIKPKSKLLHNIPYGSLVPRYRQSGPKVCVLLFAHETSGALRFSFENHIKRLWSAKKIRKMLTGLLNMLFENHDKVTESVLYGFSLSY
jgi:hypothetical protein